MSTKLHHDVRAFHKRFGHPVRTVPTIPSEKDIRFRLRLITEEFLELLAACGIEDGNAEAILRAAITDAPITVNFPELADAMGDLDYVVEGTRAVFGIDGAGVHAEIHHANMTKDPVYVATKDEHHRSPDPTAKPTKPPGWKPPNVLRELQRQGWIAPGDV